MRLIDTILTNYSLPERYLKNNKECFLDPIRKRMIVITPEEIVRQQIVLFLVNVLQIPIDKIELEVPMSYFVKGARGRADIIVYGRQDANAVPILIVECKAPNIELTDKVINQVVRYDEIIFADTIMITNGIDLIFMTWVEEEEGKYVHVKGLPTYEDLNNRHSLSIDTTPYVSWSRPEFSKVHTFQTWEMFEEYGWIGEDTSIALRPFVVNLASFFQDEQSFCTHQTIGDIKVIADKGIRFTSFGNAAGGDWAGLYRYVIIEDDYNNNQIISMTVMAKGKYNKHPVFGTTKGHSILIVAIDDFDKSHNSLQLDLDRFTTKNGDYFSIWHNGALTNGKKGAAKQSEVIKFIQERAPELVNQSGRIELGTFDNREEITWNQKTTIQFVARLIKYAILRDEFRKIMNGK